MAMIGKLSLVLVLCVLFCSSASQDNPHGEACKTDEASLVQTKLKLRPQEELKSSDSPDEEAMTRAMAAQCSMISYAAYYPHDHDKAIVPGWERLAFAELPLTDFRSKVLNIPQNETSLANDTMVLYKRQGGWYGNGVCVLGFEGSHDAEDWAAQLQWDWTDACGAKDVKKSWFLEMRWLLTHYAAFERDFLPHISDHEQCPKVFVTGHSKGGALAGLFTFCSNGHFVRDWFSDDQRETLPEMREIDGLYTYGAAATGKEALENPLAKDGIFPGKRFYNIDDIGFDPVPVILPICKHPKMDTVELHNSLFGLKHQDLDASRCECTVEPTPIHINNFGVTNIPAVSAHDMPEYTNRTLAIYEDAEWDLHWIQEVACWASGGGCRVR